MGLSSAGTHIVTQYSVRNCGLQGRRWLIPGPVQISCFGLDVCKIGVQGDWRHSRLPVMSGRRITPLSTRKRVDARTLVFRLYVRVLRTVRELHANAQWALSKERDLGSNEGCSWRVIDLRVFFSHKHD